MGHIGRGVVDVRYQRSRFERSGGPAASADLATAAFRLRGGESETIRFVVGH